MARITVRECSQQAVAALEGGGFHPVLARVLAGRGITDAEEVDYAVARLLPPEGMKGIAAAAALLADAIQRQQRVLVVADYDADGATACAVAVKGLRGFGAQVDYLVPNRFEYGYGLTPEIVALAAQSQPDLIITVDNGIASVEGVQAARERGIAVLVTDHHLPGEVLPDAAGIVNPNQPGCAFPSKHLAGVGVMFYLLIALRAEMRRRTLPDGEASGGLAALLDLVALGTIADLVRLDYNNRILVEQGLRRIRAGCACPGMAALLRISGRDARRISAQDLGFGVGPRLNAAGRLQDMSTGIECLLATEDEAAMRLARQLDTLNRERQDIEAGMHESALLDLDAQDPGSRYTLSLCRPDWHQGVIGILASRLKERFHRPVVAFAPAGDGWLKGSGRSIPGLHLRDALDLVAKRQPGVLKRFGGHAMAAGLTIAEADYALFSATFEAVVRDLLPVQALQSMIETDGEITPGALDVALAELLDQQVWGQGFAPPEFSGVFTVASQRVVGERHTRLRLESGGRGLDAIQFGSTHPLPTRVMAVYRLQINEFNGTRGLQLVLRHWQGVA